jgi:hypothetical protein
MVILGSCEKQKQISVGKFFCLTCNNIRYYKQKCISKYITLFSIPLFKIKTLYKSVECQDCKNGYEPNILEPESQQILKMEAISKYSLKRGAPVEDVKTQLIEAGADAEVAEGIIHKVLA